MGVFRIVNALREKFGYYFLLFVSCGIDKDHLRADQQRQRIQDSKSSILQPTATDFHNKNTNIVLMNGFSEMYNPGISLAG